MPQPISSRLAIVILAAATAAFPVLVSAQSSQDAQTESVADAARRAREKKKAAEKQPAPVITDDTLKRTAPAAQPDNAPAPAPSSEAAPGPSASAPAPPQSSSAPAAAPAQQPNAGDGDQKAKESAELASLKQQLAEAQKALELLQRDSALAQDTYLSNPDHARDTAGKAKLDAMLKQIADNQQGVDALKAELAALQSAAGSSTPASTPPPPKP